MDLEQLAKLNVATVRAITKGKKGKDTSEDAQVVKAEDIEPGAAAVTVLKAVDEQRVTWGVAYPALRPDVGRAQDGCRDFADIAVVEKAAWDFLASGRQIGLHHQDGTIGHGTVVESYLHRGDPMVVKAVDGSKQTVNPGDWCMSVRWDEPTFALVKARKVNGYSPQGTGRRQAATPDRLAQLRG